RFARAPVSYAERHPSRRSCQRLTVATASEWAAKTTDSVALAAPHRNSRVSAGTRTPYDGEYHEECRSHLQSPAPDHMRRNKRPFVESRHSVAPSCAISTRGSKCNGTTRSCAPAERKRSCTRNQSRSRSRANTRSSFKGGCSRE